MVRTPEPIFEEPEAIQYVSEVPEAIQYVSEEPEPVPASFDPAEMLTGQPPATKPRKSFKAKKVTLAEKLIDEEDESEEVIIEHRNRPERKKLVFTIYNKRLEVKRHALDSDILTNERDLLWTYLNKLQEIKSRSLAPLLKIEKIYEFFCNYKQ